MEVTNFESYKVKNVDKLLINPNLYWFTGRETSVSRDEIWISWLLNHGTKSVTKVPNKDIVDYYVDKESFLACMKVHAEYLLENWKKHKDKYHTMKQSLLENAQKLSSFARERME